MIPNTLSIAGIDPSGGAGVIADVKAMSALGAYATGVVAALTSQSTQGVVGIYPIDPVFVKEQIDVLFADVRIDAVKIGMLGQQPVIRAVIESLSHWQPKHIVLDPVMVAKSGDHLLEKAATAEMREGMLPLATMITPNLPEAGVLLDMRPAETVKEMYGAAEKLHRLMADEDNRWVFLKGGHLPGSECTDLLYNGDQMIEMPAPRIDTKNTHGTGCTLSAALAALLPQHEHAVDAAKAAKKYLYAAIARSSDLTVGSGHGPVNHFHHWWPIIPSN